MEKEQYPFCFRLETKKRSRWTILFEKKDGYQLSKICEINWFYFAGEKIGQERFRKRKFGKRKFLHQAKEN